MAILAQETHAVAQTGSQFWYAVLIPLLPFIGFMFNGFFGKHTPKKIVGTAASVVVWLSFILSAILAFQAGSFMKAQHVDHIVVNIFTWMSVGGFEVNFAFYIDALSLAMICMVTFVSALIHVYSTGYIAHDEGYTRFFTYLNLFVFFMLTLVLADNYVLLFVGWEGVGLCSYLLIGFWYKKLSATQAGKKAFIVNRIGDFGFLIGMFLLFWSLGSLSFENLFASVHHGLEQSQINTINLACIFMFLGACGKSAQIPLYVWLPDAMEGPTPVSALIHAATMVTAGVYMVCRSHLLYSASIDADAAIHAQTLVAWVGALTAFWAATIAIAQQDIKKVLAYSTVSQLGYMMLAAGIGAYTAAIFHLLTHAFFKACLFLGSGSVIHGMEHALHHAGVKADPQDMRNMGGLAKKMPGTYWTMLIATVAIAGIPPLAGFFSKDEILWEAFWGGAQPNSAHPEFLGLWIIGAITALMTAFYMFRMIFKTFYGKFRSEKKVEEGVHESLPSMVNVLWVLAFFSTFIGWIGVPKFWGFNVIGDKVLNTVFGGGHGESAHAVHAPLSLEWTMIAVSVVIAIIGIWLAKLWINDKPELGVKVRDSVKPVYNWMGAKWYIDELYAFLFTKPGKAFSDWLWKFIDVRIIDGAVNGTAKLARDVGEVGRALQTGQVREYALSIFFGATVLIFMAILAAYGILN